MSKKPIHWYRRLKSIFGQSLVRRTKGRISFGEEPLADPHPLFDAEWYSRRNPDIVNAGFNPMRHFLWFGWKEGRNPHRLFDVEWYLARNSDIADAGLNPLLHFIDLGWKEGRDPHPLFNVEWYLALNLDVAEAGLNPLLHFIDLGWKEGRDPHPLFNVEWYLARNPDVAKAGWNPLLHYIDLGWKEGQDPHPLFDVEWYLARNPDVAKAGWNPLLHYIDLGWKEGQDPHPLFDVEWYLVRNPDVAKAGWNPLLHYIDLGWKEGRDPHRLFSTTWYLDQYLDVKTAGLNPLLHYVQFGAPEHRTPHPGFDSEWYCAAYGDVGEGVDPLTHFLEHRHEALRNPSSSIDLVEHARKFPAAKADKVHELAHFLGQESCYAVDDDFAEAFAKDGIPRTRMHEGLARIANGRWEWSRYGAMRARLAQAEQRRAEQYPRAEPSIPLAVGNGSETEGAPAIVIPTFEHPLVSIVIPVYNKSALTRTCLRTIVESNCKTSYEVLVADDASVDPDCLELAHISGLTFLRSEKNLGFGGNCNRAAAAARGKFVLFLNNDTLVQAGFLDAMVDAYEAGVGIVGPQVLYPSGLLQEAGGRVRVDCSPALIGHGASPKDPRFGYRRDVEYISGACLLIERALFDELGGFDPLFYPAYYEDVDLCFRVRDRGLRVVYEPTARIVHFMSETMSSLSPAYKYGQSARSAQNFSERWQARLEANNAVKAIAFYLPQYHMIPENDLWWAPGFTEWTNVSKAKPNYPGHDQPRLPADLGHYDLTSSKNIRKQIELAMQYGLHGFCFYYYWFNGRRILEAPLELYLEDKSLDFPFCLCWANENWSRRWDGRDQDLLLQQEYSTEDDKAIIHDLMRFMRDGRYIQVEGKPLVIVYRWDLLPSIADTVQVWREECRRAGIGEIFVASVDSFDLAWKLKNAADFGLDASIGFPPHNMGSPVTKKPSAVSPSFTGTVDDYETVGTRYATELPLRPFTHFPGVLPGWDNTPRRQDAPFILDNSSPGAFRAWLEHALEFSRDFNVPERRMVFINAWNEWGEGAYLEPDQRYGHAYLTALRDALDSHKYQKRNG